MLSKKRHRSRRDINVVRTERDGRRSSAREEDEEIEELDRLEMSNDISYAMVTSMSGYRKSLILRKKGQTVTTSFPFLRLPAEVRNMIYRYLVVSTNRDYIIIEAGNYCYFPRGGIQTAILSTNHQIFHEAGNIMYSENKCAVNIFELAGGLSLRQDDPKTKHITTKALRSGRRIDMVKSRGLIYEQVATRLKHLELRITIPDRKVYDRFHSVRTSRDIRLKLQELHATLMTRHEQMMTDNERAKAEGLRTVFEIEATGGEDSFKTTSDVAAEASTESVQKREDTNVADAEGKEDPKKKHIGGGKGWRVVITANDTSLVMLKNMIRPLLNKHIVAMTNNGELEVVLKGKLPEGWEKIFRKYRGSPKFGNTKVQMDRQALKEDDFGSKDITQFYQYPMLGYDSDSDDSDDSD